MRSFDDFKNSFIKILSENGLESYTSENLCESFYNLTALLLEVNEKMNLTAITDEDEIVLKHYADCIRLAKYIPQGASLIDVGCGGGFPCLPLGIVRPDIKITALDSTEKKLVFVSDAAEKLKLNIKVLAGRAEELAREGVYREKFDFVSARAVAALNILSEWCIPFVRKGGIFAAMKTSGEELGGAANAIHLTGGRLKKVDETPLSGMSRAIILIDKVSPTPSLYPRANAKIKKSPL